MSLFSCLRPLFTGNSADKLPGFPPMCMPQRLPTRVFREELARGPFQLNRQINRATLPALEHASERSQGTNPLVGDVLLSSRTKEPPLATSPTPASIPTPSSSVDCGDWSPRPPVRLSQHRPRCLLHQTGRRWRRNQDKRRQQQRKVKVILLVRGEGGHLIRPEPRTEEEGSEAVDAMGDSDWSLHLRRLGSDEAPDTIPREQTGQRRRMTRHGQGASEQAPHKHRETRCA